MIGVIFSVISLLVIPIAIISIIVHLASKKNGKSAEKKDGFENTIRTVYTYILLLGFLIASITSFISAVNTMAEYLLPEETENIYSEKDNIDFAEYRDKELDDRNNKNEMVVNMITSAATVIVCVPMFVYHMNLTKKEK